MPRCSPAVVASLCFAAFACGKGNSPAGSCQHDFDCPTGESCVSGACKSLPCGGVCARPCTLNSDCDTSLFCNSQLKSCTECAFDSQCAGKTGKPVCDTTSGSCAACNVDFDCVKALGAGHFCDSHACKAGCNTTADCNAGLGETCDASTAPGKCIQCHTSSDCAAQGPAASACDETGHCVQCSGASQAAANTFCSSGTPECNLATRTCVGCLPANNQSGLDCGYANGATMDPHDAETCDPATFLCTGRGSETKAAGCEFDSQCGCPRTVGGGTVESACSRFPDQEHCDKTRTTMSGVTGATLGACVQCTENTHCEYKIHGTTQYSGQYAAYDGSRCVADSCVEGCDTDNDCWPDHATSNGKICHLGNDANNHKCVDCACDEPGADPSFCEVNSTGGRACSNTAGGKPRVCDATTLLCRRKHEGESCDASSECGAQVDPVSASECVAVGGTGDGFCAIENNDSGTFCSATHGAPGRCAAFCNDTCSCVNGSSCHNASDTAGAPNKACISSKCSY